MLQASNNCERCTSIANSWLKLAHNRFASGNFNCKSETSQAQVFTCIAEVLSFLDNKCAKDKEEIDVLVTGSLHLVGATLSAIGE